MNLIFLWFLIILIFLVYQIIKIKSFNVSSYHNLTGNTYFQVIFDKGLKGEYLTYKELKFIEKDGNMFLFNVYLPKKSNNQETTEIDVIAITHYGIMVFESKNYGGWIFGDEKSAKWCQSLPASKGSKSQKEYFFNPINQNKGHISALKQLLEEKGINVPYWNVIVFSERCELKKMSITSQDISVVKRNEIHKAIKKINALSSPVVSNVDILRIYETLYPYSQVSDEVKTKHIADVTNRVKK